MLARYTRIKIRTNFFLYQDPQKRAIYDSGDRSRGSYWRHVLLGPSGFSSRGAQFDGELSPEDLFNMFFGGGGGGGFGPGFATSFGGGPSAFTSLLQAP